MRLFRTVVVAEYSGGGDSSIITQATILQTLLVFSTGKKGSEIIIKIEDLSPLIKCSAEHETPMQILQYAFVNSVSEPLALKSRLKTFLPSLFEDMLAMDKASRLRILSFLSDLLARFPSEVRRAYSSTLVYMSRSARSNRYIPASPIRHQLGKIRIYSHQGRDNFRPQFSRAITLH